MIEVSRTISIVSGVSAFDGRPYCQVTLDTVDGRGRVLDSETIGQLTPEAVRAMALDWLDAASSSDFDAAVLAEMRATGISDEVTAHLLTNLRERRRDA